MKGSHAVIGIVVALALIGGGYFFGWRNGRGDLPEPTIVVDTVIRVDTLRIVEPVVVERTIRDTIEVRVNDTVAVYLPREELTYRDSTYLAIVSGVQPSLDYLEVYPRTETVTIRETIVEKAPRWSLGIQGGVGITPKGVQPYLGIGAEYRIPIGRR